VYERYGFEPLETPAVENIETLMGKYGEEGNQLIFKILKRGVHESTGEADLALRYDLTVPLARVVAEYRDKLPKVFKRYQIQPVWRADRPARGRFREFYQCDVDVLGSRSMVVEAEICAAVSDVLTKLGFEDFTILLNHREVLEKIMTVQGVDPSQLGDAFTVWDKLDKIGVAGARREWEDREIYLGAYDDLIELLYHDLGELRTEFRNGDNENWNEDMLERFPMAMGDSEEAHANQGLDELSRILEYAGRTSARGKIRLAPNLARGLSYYTGTIMEIKVEGMPSLGGGGRYDNLVGMFLGKDVPACGFSLGLERIIVVMTERGMFPADLVSSPADVMVTIWNEDSMNESIALAHELRATGLRVDLYPDADKMGKQFKYASSRGIQFVAVLGDDERARGEVAIKNMRSGEQRSVNRAEVAEELRKEKHS
ncbi:MAG TPA: histidine--tRNA ligase, partial [Pyrinomonadaceae bacterium]|nr:histidine--tRNA ligase [Pyrinomonadaceae bacterium]